MNYNEDFKHIRESLNNNTLTIFVGSGVSRNSGCVEWWKIIDTFAEELKIKDKEPYYKKSYDEKGEVTFSLDTTFETMIKIPQIYFNEFGKNKYYELLQKLFVAKYVPHEIHKFLIRRRPKHFITTNYDTLIEDTAKEFMEAYNIISSDLDIKPMNNDRLIIKMHGDLKNKNLVLKEDDYLNYSKNFKLTEILVKGIVATNITLFVGYSLSDYNVKQIIADIPHDNNSKPRAYFINLDGDYNIHEDNYYSKKGIKVLYVKKSMEEVSVLGSYNLSTKLHEFLELAFELPINNSIIDEALTLLEPFSNFYLGKNGIQFLLSEYGVKKSDDSFRLHSTTIESANLFSPANITIMSPYLEFNNIQGLNDSWNNRNFENCEFKFLYEYDKKSPIEKALQNYYLGNYPESYKLFVDVFNQSKMLKNYKSIAVCAYNIRKMNHLNFEPNYEISTDELDFIMDNIPKNYSYLRKLYQHEVVNDYIKDIFHATLTLSIDSIDKIEVGKRTLILDMTLISFTNFITINKISLDGEFSDISNVLYFAILKILQNKENPKLKICHVYLIYIFFNCNLLKKLKSEYRSPIKLENQNLFVDKLMKDWDLQLLSSKSCHRLASSLYLLRLLDLNSQNIVIIKEKIKLFETSLIDRYQENINGLINHLDNKKPAK